MTRGLFGPSPRGACWFEPLFPDWGCVLLLVSGRIKGPQALGKLGMLLSPGTETGAMVPAEAGFESHLALELPSREPWDLSRSLEKGIGGGLSFSC